MVNYSSAAANLPERLVAVDFDFLRQTEHSFADDVALDLVGATADRCEVGIERQKVRIVGEGMLRAVEQAFGADNRRANAALLVQIRQHGTLAKRHHGRRRALLEVRL